MADGTGPAGWPKQEEWPTVKTLMEVAASALETAGAQSVWVDSVRQLGIAMGALSHLSYEVLDVQSGENSRVTSAFTAGFESGLATGRGVEEMFQRDVAGEG